MDTIGLVVLAAGASTRLGEPKQQLRYQGQTLLQHATDAALRSGCKPVVVVLGANADSVMAALPASGIVTIHNPEWAEGIAASIRYGLAALLQMEPAVTGVIFLLCDQPFVSADLLEELMAKKTETQKPIIACTYQQTLGTPVLFDKCFFGELQCLYGQEGAKKVIYRHPEAVATVPFPLGAIDIDTPADYAALQQHPPPANE